jgi:phospholipid/cholesterol/gamma-HCH transport system substrate-binding protein
MVKRKTEFMVGFFVIIGVVIGVAGLVWIGASQYFQKGSTYVTYFAESVQGLQVDSAVKYLGVSVGRVEKIRVAPDFKLIEVQMKIDMAGNPEFTTVAKLAMAGITGIVYVELARKKPADIRLAPKLTFSPPYVVIASRPSEIRELTSTFAEIVNNAREIDFKGISDQIKATMKTMESFVADERIKKTLTNLESTTVGLQKIVARVEKITEEDTLERLVVELDEVLEEAKRVVDLARVEVEGLALAETSLKVRGLLDTADDRMRAATTEVQVTTENMRRVSEALENLLHKLSADPSQLLFSEPPPKDKESGGK